MAEDPKLEDHIKETRLRFHSLAATMQGYELKISNLETKCMLIDAMSVVLYGDHSNPEDSGLKGIVSKLSRQVHETESQRKKDRGEEEANEKEILSKLTTLEGKGLLGRGGRMMLKDIAAAVSIIMSTVVGLLLMGQHMGWWK